MYVVMKTLFNEDDAHIWAHMEASKYEEIVSIDIDYVNYAWRASVTYKDEDEDYSN